MVRMQEIEVKKVKQFVQNNEGNNSQGGAGGEE